MVRLVLSTVKHRGTASNRTGKSTASMTKENEQVVNPRAEIDAIDDELLGLLNKRADIALRVGKLKTQGDASLCDQNREREVLSRLCHKNTGPFDDQSIYEIFQRIIDESLHLQQTFYH